MSGAKQRVTLNNLNEPQQMRELNRQLGWIWDQLLGGLSMKSLNAGTQEAINSKAAQTAVDELGKTVAANSSAIEQTAKEIRAEVQDEVNGLETAIEQNSTDILMLAARKIGATQLLKDTKHLTLGSTSDADRWAASAGVTVSDMDNGFVKATFEASGLTADGWKELRSPLTRLPDGWLGKQVTLSAWIYSDDWAGMDAGGQGPITWSLILSQGGVSRLNYCGKYNIVKAGSVALGTDGASDVALENSKWVRVSTTYTLDASGITQGTGTLADNTHIFTQFYLRRNGTYSVYAPKLEFGNVATDWSEHPEELNAGSSVRINEKGVYVSGGEIEMQSTSGDEYLHITGSGIDASSLSAPNVTPRYDGPATLYVDPNATSAQIAAGNYHRSLADALAKINGRWITRSVTINLAAGMTEYGVLQIRGMAGNGTITINGNGAKLVGQMLIYLAGVPITVDGLNVDVSANGYGFDVGNSTVYVSIKNSVITGSGTGWGVKSMHGASVMVTGCELYDLTRSLYVQYGGRLHASGNQGNCVVAAAEGGFMTLAGTQPCHQTTWTAYKATCGQIFTENVTVDQGSKPTAEAEPTTVTYNFTSADSYAGGWGYFEDEDVRQGYISGRRIYGTIWFDAATIKTALTGKTIKQASLRLYMQSGVGRGVSVSVQTYGTNMAYDGRSGAPALTTTYGTIGSTTPGQLNEITIPTQVITDIVNGTIQALVLYSDDTDYYSGRSYSKNYARFDGSTSGDGSTRPRLTVTYT